MSRSTLYHYLLPIFWFVPFLLQATQESTSNIQTLPNAPKTDKKSYPYPRSIQLRSGWMVHENNEKLLIAVPTTIDLDILCLHACFGRQLDTYPRIGLSFLLPYTIQKEPKLRFPSIWGLLTYIELYQSSTNRTTWGNRVSIGCIKNSALVKANPEPGYSALVTKEVTYHWLFTPSWQLNLGIGLLINCWIKKTQPQPNTTSLSGGTDIHKQIEAFRSENDLNVVNLAPLVTIGIRYITDKKFFFKLGVDPIHARKPKSSRVDCGLMVTSKWLGATQKRYLIFRGSVSLAFAINPHNRFVVALELGHNNYKRALLGNMLANKSRELTALLGHEVAYGRYLLQLQLGCEITDPHRLTVQTHDEYSFPNVLNKRGSMGIKIQYMLTDHLFVGISTRSQEWPGLYLGISC